MIAKTINIPRRSWPFFFAKFAMTSPFVKVKVPRDGSVASCWPECLISCIFVVTIEITNPFHTVTRSDLTKHGVVAQDVDIGSISEFWVVRSRTEVEFAVSFGNGVKASGSSGGRCGRAGRWVSRWRCGSLFWSKVSMAVRKAKAEHECVRWADIESSSHFAWCRHYRQRKLSGP